LIEARESGYGFIDARRRTTVLTRIDRIQMAVPSHTVAAIGWVGILGAELASEDRLTALAARRFRYRVGNGAVEFLEPDGDGPVADAVARRGGHLFAAGIATPDLEALQARLRDVGIEAPHEAGQLHLDPALTGLNGMRLVISPDEERAAIGGIDHFYEVTNLVHDAVAAVADFARLFGLDASAFVPINSPHYGYDGTLTLFRPGHLHRIEVITPRNPANTMGRFFGRVGESLYMAFAESADVAAIAARAQELGAGHTVEPAAERRHGKQPNTIFLHPPALGGMMLGISRRTVAWRWSGSPEREETAQ
jgi:hypothetical protein